MNSPVLWGCGGGREWKNNQETLLGNCCSRVTTELDEVEREQSQGTLDIFLYHSIDKYHIAKNLGNTLPTPVLYFWTLLSFGPHHLPLIFVRIFFPNGK